ncbi:unnamed protein product [Brassica rapa subsp. trilocularis]|uniref:Uncharacterized protein n=2 Tax=Brassica TaxID=3705 RepID=M4CF05_BRACM|nr:unnamed protein product [Brassica napus]CDY32754.1 BnaA10g10950D [Brassica napus]
MEETRKKEDERGRDTAEAKEMTTQMSVPGGDDNDDEYTPEEIMQLVESSSSQTMNVDEESFRVRFIDDPYAVPVVVQSSTSTRKAVVRRFPTATLPPWRASTRAIFSVAASVRTARGVLAR